MCVLIMVMVFWGNVTPIEPIYFESLSACQKTAKDVMVAPAGAKDYEIRAFCVKVEE